MGRLPISWAIVIAAVLLSVTWAAVAYLDYRKTVCVAVIETEEDAIWARRMGFCQL